MKKLASLFCLFFQVGIATGAVTLAPVFTDHAVLQRDEAVVIWGTANAGELVTVEFGDQEVQKRADQGGAWSLELAPMRASSIGRELRVSGDNEIVLKDVLVGDVWLCGGQSNMQWTMGQLADTAEAIRTANYPVIRHFKVAKQLAHRPKPEFEGAWKLCSPETVVEFSAVGFFFGRALNRELDVPIGLINSTWGGTPVEAWLPPLALSSPEIIDMSLSHQIASVQGRKERFERYFEALKKWEEEREEAAGAGRVFDSKKPKWPGNLGAERFPGVLYNGMVAGLEHLSVKGVIWYQGESNADQPETYTALFSALIDAWRDSLNKPDLPFYWVQLTRWNAGDPQGTQWAELRDAQSQALALPHTGQAVTIDLGEAKNVHPGKKDVVGERLARIALKRSYGFDLEDSGPVLSRVAVDGAFVRVRFEHASGLDTIDGGAPAGFEIVGRDGGVRKAAAEIEGNDVIVSIPEGGVELRYAWRNFPEANLVNGDGLPARPFRVGL